MMKIISKPIELQKEIIKLKKEGKTIGFVPTMGALHKGHLSLIKAARKNCDIVVVSIFVNPLQFGPKEDLRKYPRDFKKDIFLCKEYTDVLFYPSAKEMYPDDFLTTVEVEKLGSILCGASRPGHFKGVTTVVNKLFNIVLPDIAYFGQKDVQQAIIIKKMVKDLNIPIKIKVMPIVREPDGLAMSSRNIYLSGQERKEAVVLYKSLVLAKNLINPVRNSPSQRIHNYRYYLRNQSEKPYRNRLGISNGVKNGISDCKKIISKMRSLILEVKSAKIDYVSIVNLNTLEALGKIENEALILLAVFIGKIRLIDNLLVKSK